MEFKFRAIDVDEQGSTCIPPLPSISFFAEQALRAGCSGPDFGRATEFFPNRSDVREAIQRELEKDRIREEIIAAEVARKRLLEAEVRREMFLEREMALRRAEGFSLFRGSAASSAMRFERRSLEERVALPLEERLGYQARRSIGSFEMLPFQRNAEPKISGFKPPSGVSKDKVIFLVKPEGNLSGTKRKAVTQPAAGASDHPSVHLKKKSKEGWSCAICQVSATSERGLNEHLRGKKHKSREAGLITRKIGKNYAIGLFPKKIGKPVKFAGTTDNQNSEQEEKLVGEVLLQQKSNTEDVKQNNEGALQVIQDINDSTKENVASAQKMEKNEDYKKRLKFWCEMCQIGTHSLKVMNRHRKGKKHVSRLQKLDQNGGSVLAGHVEEAHQKEKDPEMVCKDEKEETRNNAVGAADGEAVENHQTADDVASSGQLIDEVHLPR